MGSYRLENAQAIAEDESPRTTKLHDRTAGTAIMLEKVAQDCELTAASDCPEASAGRSISTKIDRGAITLRLVELGALGVSQIRSSWILPPRRPGGSCVITYSVDLSDRDPAHLSRI